MGEGCGEDLGKGLGKGLREYNMMYLWKIIGEGIWGEGLRNIF